MTVNTFFYSSDVNYISNKEGNIFFIQPNRVKTRLTDEEGMIYVDSVSTQLTDEEGTPYVDSVSTHLNDEESTPYVDPFH